MYICGGFYFVCDHGRRRNAKRYNFGCSFLLGGEANKCYTRKSYRLANINSLCDSITQTM